MDMGLDWYLLDMLFFAVCMNEQTRQSRLQQTTFINIFHCFSEKVRLDVSSEPSARQRSHMKNQVLFSSKDKSKKLKCSLLQFLFGTMRVNFPPCHTEILRRLRP